MKASCIFICLMLVMFTVIILIPVVDAANESYINQSEQQSIGFQPTELPAQFLPLIYEKATEGANVIVTGSGKNSVQNSSDSLLLSSLAATGERIIFQSNRSTLKSTLFNLYSMNADGTGIIRLTINNDGHDGHPSISHDGKKIAYEGWHDYLYSWQIYVMNADGTGLKRVSGPPGMAFEPDWSPDGSHIVYTSNWSGNVYNIYVMNADGTGLTRLTTTSANDYSPAWSPDGSKIVFESGYRAPNNWYQIYVMNADGTGQTQLTPDITWNLDPAWSPDGSKIVFRSNRDGGPGSLYIMNADGTGQTQLTFPPGKRPS